MDPIFNKYNSESTKILESQQKLRD